MQLTLKDRETITGATTFYTPPIDVTSMSLFTFNLTVHAASGASPTLTVAFETSDNLEDWANVYNAVSQNLPGTALGAVEAKTNHYGRYVRAVIETGGADPMFNYSLWMNTFASS